MCVRDGKNINLSSWMIFEAGQFSLIMSQQELSRVIGKPSPYSPKVEQLPHDPRPAIDHIPL